MKPSHHLCAIAAVLGLAASTASAAFISISFSGPGGTGANPLTSGVLTEPSLTFTSVNFIDVTMTVDSATNYQFNQAPLFGNTSNNTGQTWTGFDFQMLAGGVGSFINSPTAPSSWADFPGGILGVFSPTDITFSGENVPTSSSIGYGGFFSTTGPGTVTIRETPIVAPEPSSLMLMGIGLSGLGFARRRKR